MIFNLCVILLTSFPITGIVTRISDLLVIACEYDIFNIHSSYLHRHIEMHRRIARTEMFRRVEQFSSYHDS